MDRLDIRPGHGGLIDILPSALAGLGALAVPDDPIGLVRDLEGVRRVAVLLVDGMGFHLVKEAAEVGATLADIHDGRLGSIRSLHCGFPSTTPVSLVGLGTAAPPGVHGVMGFSVRVPGTDRVLNHVRWRDDPPAERWQPTATVFERAAASGVRTAVVTKAEFDGSGLTRSAYRGAEFRGVDGRHALVTAMIEALNEGIPLVYGYHADLDHAGHVAGVGSDEWRDAARGVDQIITMLTALMPGDAALVVTADHGQINIGTDGKFDMDTVDDLRENVVAAAGEARVRYVYTRAGAAADVRAAWQAILGDAAEVVTREEAIDAGWYGRPVHPAHAARIGDVIAVSHDGYAVVRSKAEPGEAGLIGYHGSYTPTEVEVPLIVIPGTSSG